MLYGLNLVNKWFQLLQAHHLPLLSVHHHQLQCHHHHQLVCPLQSVHHQVLQSAQALHCQLLQVQVSVCHLLFHLPLQLVLHLQLQQVPQVLLQQVTVLRPQQVQVRVCLDHQVLQQVLQARSVLQQALHHRPHPHKAQAQVRVHRVLSQLQSVLHLPSLTFDLDGRYLVLFNG